MRYLYSVIGLILLLYGCSNAGDKQAIEELQRKVEVLEQTNSELMRQKEISEKQRIAENQKEQLFKKKQECQKLIAGIEKKLDDDQVTPDNGKFFVTFILDKVFYSKRQNSCLYSVNILSSAGMSYALYDALTHQKLEMVTPKGTEEEKQRQAQDFVDILYSYGY